MQCRLKNILLEKTIKIDKIIDKIKLDGATLKTNNTKTCNCCLINLSELEVFTTGKPEDLMTELVKFCKNLKIFFPSIRRIIVGINKDTLKSTWPLYCLYQLDNII